MPNNLNPIKIQGKRTKTVAHKKFISKKLPSKIDKVPRPAYKSNSPVTQHQKATTTVTFKNLKSGGGHKNSRQHYGAMAKSMDHKTGSDVVFQANQYNLFSGQAYRSIIKSTVETKKSSNKTHSPPKNYKS